MAKPKIPSIAVATTTLGKKVPKATPGNDGYESCHPVWCFNYVDRGGDFAWDAIDSADAKSVLNKLRDLSSMTWREIHVGANRQFHSIAATDIAKNARDRLSSLKLDDVDRVYSFRLDQVKRFWAARHDNYAFLLWWDPTHQVYPVELKNT